MENRPGLRKAKRPVVTFIIRGDDIQYVEGLQPGDYAVIQNSSIVHLNDTVYGKAFDSRGGLSEFAMPITKFVELEAKEFVPEAASRVA